MGTITCARVFHVFFITLWCVFLRWCREMKDELRTHNGTVISADSNIGQTVHGAKIECCVLADLLLLLLLHFI